MLLKYYAAAIFSFIVWGVFSLILKPLSNYPALDILTFRVAFAAIVIALISLSIRFKISKANLSLIKSLPKEKKVQIVLANVFSAVMLALNWYLYIYVMNNVSVKSTSLAYLICPILTTVLAAIFLKEKLKFLQWLAVGLSILSCSILAYGHFVDMIYSVIIALSYAIYLVLQKASTILDKFFTLTLHILISALILIPLGFNASSEIVHTSMFYQYVFIIAVLFTIIPLYLNMYALKGLDSSVVGILLYINPIIAFGLAIFYFGEPLNFNQAIAYFLILIAVLIFNIPILKRFSKKISL